MIRAVEICLQQAVLEDAVFLFEAEAAPEFTCAARDSLPSAAILCAHLDVRFPSSSAPFQA